MFPRRRPFLSIMIITLLIVPQLVMAGPAIEEKPEQFSLRPTLTISPLDPQSAQANVTAKDGATVTYTGTVTVTKPPVGTVTVYLDGETSSGYLMTVEPSTIPFTSPGTVAFTAVVMVPQGASANGTTKVMVAGIASYPGGSRSAYSTATLEIGQYFDMELLVIPVKKTGNPQEFNIVIRNTGNGNDTFSLSFPDTKDLENDGFDLSVSNHRSEELMPNGNGTIKVKIGYGVSTPSGKRSIKVRVTSDSSKAGENETYKDVLINMDVEALGGGSTESFMLIGGIVASIVILVLAVVLIMKRRRQRTGPVKKDNGIKRTDPGEVQETKGIGDG